MPGDGAQVKVWGWYTADGKWIPALVDSAGRLVMSIILARLDDIEDVDVPSPTDLYILYWNDTNSKWECRALSDWTVPAHKDRHDPNNGADKLDTAAPVKVGSANAIGTSHSFPRADHVHEREHAKYTDAEALAQALTLRKKLKPNVTRWVIPGWVVDGADANAAVAETVYYQPIQPEEDTTYIRVAIQVTVGAVGSAEIWLYEWNDGVPGAKIADLGTIADTNVVQLHELTISQALTAGTCYFLALRCTGAPTLAVPNDSLFNQAPVSGWGSSFMYFGKVILTVASATLTDPATAPTGGATVDACFMGMREN